MKIGILQTGHAPDELRPVLGDYANLFEKLLDGQGFDFDVYSVVDGEFPKDASVCDGWLVTGSKHGAYEDHPWIAPLEDLIREAYALERPMVGVCFGHQIIAQALGGTVEKFDGGWAVGRQTYDWNGQDVALNAWHQDQVVALPDGAEVLASNAFCANAALIYDKRAFTVQPHPEFGDEVISGLITHRGASVPAPLVDQARNDLGRDNQNAELARLIGQFFKTGVPA